MRDKLRKKKQLAKMSIADYINMPMLYMTRLTQNQNDSINSILQYGRVIRKYWCVVFFASGFPYLILRLRQWKGKVATTYL